MNADAANPFNPVSDPDRHHIWNRLVLVDSQAFVRGDWSMIEADFDAERFEGVRCAGSSDPDQWTITFPDLARYRDNWLMASREFLAKRFVGLTHLEAVLKRTQLMQIDINANRALAHKKFSGQLLLEDGSSISDSRQTLYRLHRINGSWKIVGFLGYLPL